MRLLRIIFTAILILLSLAPVGEADSKDPKDWYARAQADLEVAQLTANHTEHFHQTCFLSHQAVEKYLKGVLIQEGVEPERIHHTARLLSRAEAFRPELLKFFTDLQQLDRIYISSRYPDPEFEFTEQDAARCLELAERIMLPELLEEKASKESEEEVLLPVIQSEQVL